MDASACGGRIEAVALLQLHPLAAEQVIAPATDVIAPTRSCTQCCTLATVPCAGDRLEGCHGELRRSGGDGDADLAGRERGVPRAMVGETISPNGGDVLL